AAVGEMVRGRVGAAAALQVGEDAVAALLMECLKMLAETILVIHSSPLHGRLSPRPPSSRTSPDIRRQQIFGARIEPCQTLACSDAPVTSTYHALLPGIATGVA